MEVSFPSESFIEDYICSSIRDYDVNPITDCGVDYFIRQPELGVYGIADIITVSVYYDERLIPHYSVTVIELKNQPLKSKDYAQLCRYMKCIKKHLSKYSRFIKLDVKVSGVLAGMESTEDDFVFLSDVMTDIDTYYLSLDMGKGFRSKLVNNGRWSRSNDSFRDISSHVRSYSEWQG